MYSFERHSRLRASFRNFATALSQENNEYRAHCEKSSFHMLFRLFASFLVRPYLADPGSCGLHPELCWLTRRCSSRSSEEKGAECMRCRSWIKTDLPSTQLVLSLCSLSPFSLFLLFFKLSLFRKEQDGEKSSPSRSLKVLSSSLSRFRVIKLDQRRQV